MTVIGMTGLGKKALILAGIIKSKGITVIGYDGKDRKRKMADEAGVVTTSSVHAVALHLPQPKIIWVMARRSKPSRALLQQLAGLLEPDDVVIDGSRIDAGVAFGRSVILNQKGILYLHSHLPEDSGKPQALFCGNQEAYDQCKSLFSKIFVEGGFRYLGDAAHCAIDNISG